MSWEVLRALLFYLFAAGTLFGAAVVAFHRNLTYSVVGLMVSLLSVAGLFGVVNADFLAVLELIVYVGGVVILFLFAVYLTKNIKELHISNHSFNYGWGIGGGIFAFVIIGYGLLKSNFTTHLLPTNSTVRALGNSFLTHYLLPFEVISLVLLVVLIGAVLIAKREVDPKEKKDVR